MGSQKIILNLLLIVMFLFAFTCSKQQDCIDECNEILGENYTLKVTEVDIYNHNEFIIGKDLKGSEVRYGYRNFFPNILNLINSGDFVIKQRNNKFFCVISSNKYTIFSLNCSNIPHTTKVHIFKRKVVYDPNKNYYIDSTGLYVFGEISENFILQ